MLGAVLVAVAVVGVGDPVFMEGAVAVGGYVAIGMAVDMVMMVAHSVPPLADQGACSVGIIIVDNRSLRNPRRGRKQSELGGERRRL